MDAVKIASENNDKAAQENIAFMFGAHLYEHEKREK
jgi:hypothetical protein